MNESYSAGQWKVYWSRRGWDLSFADSRGVLSIHCMSNLLHRWKINTRGKKRNGRQSEMSRKESQSASVWWAASAKKNVEITFLHFLCAKCLMEWAVRSVLDKNPLCYSFITLTKWTCVCICVKCRNREEGKKGAGYSCTTIKTTRYLFPACVFSPNYAGNSESHRKEEGKKHNSPHWP